MQYIATFHSHFGATRFHKTLRAQKVKCQLKPVPRRVSSSCGTCAVFDTDGDAARFASEDVDGIYREVDEGFELLWRQKE